MLDPLLKFQLVPLTLIIMDFIVINFFRWTTEEDGCSSCNLQRTPPPFTACIVGGGYRRKNMGITSKYYFMTISLLNCNNVKKFFKDPLHVLRQVPSTVKEKLKNL